jgi:predicted RNA-binding Zn ribbon-like protein
MADLPAGLAPVLAFVNTIDVEDGTDVLADGPRAFSAWLHGERLVPRRAAVTAEELALAVDLRAGLRAELLRNNGETPAAADLRAGEDALRRLPLTAGLDAPWQAGAAGPVEAALGRIVAGYVQARADGTWSRLRRCPAEDCQWVFWDSSRNATRRWCSMRVCGNRAKVRAFQQRRG